MICVDADVAFKVIVPEELSDRARRLVADAHRLGDDMIAPPLLRFEITNIVRQRMVRDGLALDDARGLVSRLLALPISFFGVDTLHFRALEIADAHGLPAAYDAHYVALAELLACEFWTADQRLVQSLGARFPFVRWLGTYPTA